MSDLNRKIKEVIISSLELEDITPDDIIDDAPLFGKGLGLDSIDALELGIAIKENFNISFTSVNEETKKHFASINALAKCITEKQNEVKNG